MKDVRAKKHLGQHFLIVEDVTERIANSFKNAFPSGNVLEVGPGMGVLTKYFLQEKEYNITVSEIDTESIDRFVSKIIRNLEGLGENEIPTSTIGKFIMDGLSSLDQVAYVRFASVYRNFKEAKDFEQFVGNLNVYKSE